MEITLNKNSWHSKYYKWVLNSEPPKSLCPYFWISFALLVFSPIIFIVRSISWITMKMFDFSVNKKDDVFSNETLEDYLEKTKKRQERNNKTNRILGHIGKFFFYVLLGIVLFILILFIKQHGVLQLLFRVIIGALMCFTISFVIVTIVSLSDSRDNSIKRFCKKHLSFLDVTKWESVKMIVAMMKSIYKKACPLITWK